LAPIKKPTNTNSSSSFLTEVNPQNKLDSIPQGKSSTLNQNRNKNLLKGKPILFIGGGPGIKKN
jgi:hypothetical protein